jgi:phosphoserine aminotransferase
MERIFNFSAGPSMLPEPVLQKAATELVNYRESGMSVMEMSHRSKVYEDIHNGADALLRELLGIPENYTVLFLQGGASLQFAMVPMNLANQEDSADYVETGHWAAKAIEEASRYMNVKTTASSKDKNFTYIPDFPAVNQNAKYVHITTNNTIYGTRYTKIPDTGNIPLVADMSSNIMSQAYDIKKFALIYAGAQKNLAPAGVTVVIIRNDLIGKHRSTTPTMLQYAIHAKNKSLYNTPPCYSIYIMKLVLEWVKGLGGLAAMEKINIEKANILYNYLDESSFFKGTVRKEDRSLMNIPFLSPSEELNAKFLKEVEAKGFVNLAGHRTVGGMRASIYNAMPVEGVKKLVALMKEFEKNNK